MRNTEPANNREIKKVNAGRVFKRFLWDSYDNLGILILGNLLWFILCLPLVTAPASTAALFVLTNNITTGKKNSIRVFWEGFRKYFFRGSLLGLVYLLFLIIIISNLLFYQYLSQTGRVYMALLGAVNLWLLLLFSLMGIYILPLIVTQGISLWKAIKRSILLSLDNASLTILISIQVMAILFIFVFSVLGIFLIVMSLISLLLNRTLHEILRKYDEGSEEVREKRRSLREIFKPWQY